MNNFEMTALLNMGIEPVIVCLLKWTDIPKEPTLTDYGNLLRNDNCAFCDKYFYLPDCEGCPIAIKTGEECCDGTPFHKFSNDVNHRRLEDAEKKRLEMIEFLEDLASDMGITFFEDEYADLMKETRSGENG